MGRIGKNGQERKKWAGKEKMGRIDRRSRIERMGMMDSMDLMDRKGSTYRMDMDREKG
jgi:hypothetical protein